MKNKQWMQRTVIAAMALALPGLVGITFAHADEPRRWNQDEAVARVKNVLQVENSGDLPWDNIAWETDVDKAIERSEEENKPLFVYIFLKKEIGPKNAPC